MSTTFETSTEMNEILEGLSAFIRAEVIDRHDRHAEFFLSSHRTHLSDGRFAPRTLELIREVRMASAEAGYYTMLAPEAIGGAELGYEALYRVWETVFRLCGSRYWLGWHAIAHWTKGPSLLFQYVSKNLQDKYLPQLLSGETTTCFGMSEPDAGSDAWMMRTNAVREGDGWRINGEKQWISNAAHADLAIVFAVTDPDAVGRREGGVSAFLVPTDTPGFGVHSVTPMFGHVGSNEGIIQMTDVVVGPENVIGTLDDGFRLAMRGVSIGRLYNSAKGVGLARWALDQALDYVQERRAFGESISSFQGITFPLAESAMEIHAARLLGLDTARLLDAGKPARKELSMSKAFSTEAGARAIDRAIQAHGAMGFTNELGLAVAWQELRQVWIADGSAEVQRRQILAQLLRGDREL